VLVGLLGGVVAAAVKMFQGRAAPELPAPTPAPWTPIPDAEPVIVPPKVETPAPPPTPTPPPARPTVSIADLQEAPPVKKPPAKKPAAKKSAPPKEPKEPKAKELPPWVEPGPGGETPATHPIKAKMASGIFHVPGGLNYARTRPDRCYRDVAAAEADGLRPSKR